MSQDILDKTAKEKRKITRKKHYDNNKTEILKKQKEHYETGGGRERQKKYQEDHKDKYKEYRKQYYKDNKGKYRELGKDYRKNNKDSINEKQREKYKNTVNFKLRANVSASIRSMLKRNGYNKNNNSVLKYLPYTIEELRRHLESLFEPWMNWGNHGMYVSQLWDDNDVSTWTWHIDHIIPQAALLYTSMEDENFKKCWALENLRPLSAKQNILKGNR